MLQENDIMAGYTCPCCSQFVKAYKRTINSSMAMVLVMMNRVGKKGFFHIENWLKEIGHPEWRADYHKLRWWKLIEAKVETRDDGSKRNGHYKITGQGIAFAEGKLTVPKFAIIFNNQLQNFEGEEINIHQALGKRFNYDELMRGAKTDKEAKEIRSTLPTLF